MAGRYYHKGLRARGSGRLFQTFTGSRSDVLLRTIYAIKGASSLYATRKQLQSNGTVSSPWQNPILYFGKRPDATGTFRQKTLEPLGTDDLPIQTQR